MLPELTIDLKIVEDNTRELVRLCAERGIGITGVTKVFRGDPEIGCYLSVMNTKVFSMLAMLRGRIDLNPDMMPDRVVFDESGAMSLYYGDVTVLMGSGEKMEMRLKQLSGVMQELLGGGYSGTLHLETYDGSQAGLIFDKK